MDATLSRRLESCNKEMLKLRKELDESHNSYKIFEDISALLRSVERLYDRLMHFLENEGPSSVREEVLEFYFEISHFLYIYELMDDKYIIYAFKNRDEFVLRLFCVDPSGNLSECMRKGVSSILFSATLLPIQYYKSLLGGEETDYEVYANSTFDPNKRGLYLAEGVTTRYTERGKAQYEKIAGYIHEIVSAREGRYMVFFPSYSFLDNVFDSYNECYGDDDIRLLIQNDRMSEKEREDFLAEFSASDEMNAKSSLLGFCVLGGIFSEGIDLQGESLIGSIIVGTGIPMVCEENELIKKYFDDIDGEGMKYAYIYPGFNKVLQAAGRVIRTHEDTGIVALLDYRFGYSSYRQLFPKEWKNIKRVSIDTVSRELDLFWNA